MMPSLEQLQQDIQSLPEEAQILLVDFKGLCPAPTPEATVPTMGTKPLPPSSTAKTMSLPSDITSPVVANNVEGIRCSEICTTWIPTAEVPRVAPAKLNNVKLGMEALADATDAATIRGMIGPIVTGYRAWIAAQRAVAISP